MLVIMSDIVFMSQYGMSLCQI